MTARRGGGRNDALYARIAAAHGDLAKIIDDSLDFPDCVEERVLGLVAECYRWRKFSSRLKNGEPRMADYCSICNSPMFAGGICPNCSIGDGYQKRRADDAEADRDRLLVLVPRENEVESIMSLLNWVRANHDGDSSARQWLERVADFAISRLGWVE